MANQGPGKLVQAAKLKPEGPKENCPVHRPGGAPEGEATAGRQRNRRQGRAQERDTCGRTGVPAEEAETRGTYLEVEIKH